MFRTLFQTITYKSGKFSEDKRDKFSSSKEKNHSSERQDLFPDTNPTFQNPDTCQFSVDFLISTEFDVIVHAGSSWSYLCYLPALNVSYCKLPYVHNVTSTSASGDSLGDVSK